MLDQNRIARALADLKATRADLEQLVALTPAVFLAERRNLFALRYLIMQAVEAMADICQHLLRETRGILCEGYVDCLLKAGDQGIISTALSRRLRQLATLRNIIVHRYWIIDDGRLYEETRADLNDLMAFILEIESFVQKMFPTAPSADEPNTQDKG